MRLIDLRRRMSPGNPVILAHRMSGGITCELRHGQLVETRGVPG